MKNIKGLCAALMMALIVVFGVAVGSAQAARWCGGARAYGNVGYCGPRYAYAAPCRARYNYGVCYGYGNAYANQLYWQQQALLQYQLQQQAIEIQLEQQTAMQYQFNQPLGYGQYGYGN